MGRVCVVIWRTTYLVEFSDGLVKVGRIIGERWCMCCPMGRRQGLAVSRRVIAPTAVDLGRPRLVMTARGDYEAAVLRELGRPAYGREWFWMPLDEAVAAFRRAVVRQQRKRGS